MLARAWHILFAMKMFSVSIWYCVRTVYTIYIYVAWFASHARRSCNQLKMARSSFSTATNHRARSQRVNNGYKVSPPPRCRTFKAWQTTTREPRTIVCMRGDGDSLGHFSRARSTPKRRALCAWCTRGLVWRGKLVRWMLSVCDCCWCLRWGMALWILAEILVDYFVFSVWIRDETRNPLGQVDLYVWPNSVHTIHAFRTTSMQITIVNIPESFGNKNRSAKHTMM